MGYKQKLKIAQVVSLFNATPPVDYGGTELVVSNLTEELIARGHDVDLYASEDSKTKASLKSITSSLRNRFVKGMIDSDYLFKIELLNSVNAIKSNKKYDLIHLHSQFFPSISSLFLQNKILLTPHSYPDALTSRILRASGTNICSISKNYQKILPDLKYRGFVYNGIEISDCDVLKYRDEYIALGRLSKKKGLYEALSSCEKAGVRMSLSAPLPKKGDKDSWFIDKSYYDKYIHSYRRNKLLNIVDEISGNKKKSFYRSKAFLNPILWEEPFGLVMTEAMSYGTPVISFARGAAPEIIEDGKTGFLVNSSMKEKRGNWIIKKVGILGLVEAIKKVESMSNDAYLKMRKQSRQRVERKFTIDKMVDGYEEIYRRIIGSRKK